MKPAPFTYHAPESVADAVDLLAQHGDEAKPLAGGQSLVPLLSLRLARYGHLVDLNRVGELRSVARTNGAVTVGAMVRQAHAESDATIATGAPLLARALPLIGHFQIRNRGTVGGSLAHADPASELPAVALALGATFEVANRKAHRSVAADDFFAGTWTTAMDSDDLLTAIEFPVWAQPCGFAIDEAVRRHGDFAMVGVAAAIGLDRAARIDRCRIAMFGVASTPVRATAAEAALTGRLLADVDDAARTELGQLATRELEPPADVHATGAYRKRAGAVLVARALQHALEEAGRG